MAQAITYTEMTKARRRFLKEAKANGHDVARRFFCTCTQFEKGQATWALGSVRNYTWDGATRNYVELDAGTVSEREQDLKDMFTHEMNCWDEFSTLIDALGVTGWTIEAKRRYPVDDEVTYTLQRYGCMRPRRKADKRFWVDEYHVRFYFAPQSEEQAA